MLANGLWSAAASGTFGLAVFGMVLITALLHLVFFVYLPQERSSLVFVGFCVSIIAYWGYTGFVLGQVLNDVEYSALFGVVALLFSCTPFLFLLAVLRILCPDDSFPVAEKALAAVWASGTLVACGLYLWNKVIGVTTANVVCTVVLLYFVVVSIIAFVKKRNDAALVLFAVVLPLLSGLLDRFDSRLFLMDLSGFSGVTAFVLVISFVSIKRSLQPYKVFKTMSDELQKRNEEIRIKNQELANLGRLKDEFLTSTSRELQAPLQAIVSLAESFSQKLNSGIPEEFANSLRLVFFNCKRLAILIDNILDYTRFKNDRLNLNLTQFDLQLLADSVIELSQLDAGHKSIRLINKIPATFPLVYGDKKRSYQVLYNLMENAIKFSDAGTIEITASFDENQARTTVTDSGIGIEKQFQQTIFNDFEKLIHWEEKQNKGLGLGLSIARILTEKQGGKIWLESTVDIGSSFSFSLPLAENIVTGVNEQFKQPQISTVDTSETIDLEDQAPADAEVEEVGLTNIWIIDDDVVIQPVVNGFLSSDQVKITSFHEGSEPLKNIYQGKIPDLILLDILMPQTSGFELCRKIRSLYSMTELPIIFLTSKNSISDLVEAFSLGANDFIVKPFLRDELVSRVNSQLHQLRINKNLVYLRNFYRSIVNKRDPKSMVSEAIDTLQVGIPTSGITLFQDEKLIRTVKRRNEDLCIETAPPKDLFIDLYPENESDLYVCNKLFEDHSLCRFYKKQTNKDISQCSVISVFLEDLENMHIMIYRDRDKSEFSNYEIEYLKSIIHTVSTIRQNYRKLFSNTSLVEAVAFLNNKLQEVVYIKSIHPFSQVFYSNGKELKSREIQISMQDIQAYFDEKYMLRIHRSFFINPNKVLDVRKKNQIDFEVKIKTIHDEIQKLNIGRNYVSHFKRLHPNYF